jgi:hypothetical protein
MSNMKDVQIIRDLAKRYRDVANKEIQDERRDLWRKHNSLERTRPLIYVRWLAAWHEAPESKLECEEQFYRVHESFLRQMIFQDTIGDDYIIEPWITQQASRVTPPNGLWGVRIKHTPRTQPGGSWKFNSPIKEPEDLSKLLKPHHVINEEATARNVARLQDAVGDILDVGVDRAPAYRMWHGDISTDLAHLRGLEQVMWDMVDNPEWLHKLVGFMSDGVLTTHNEAEAAGDWHLCDHQNQAMSYALDLPDPSGDGDSVKRDQLWGYFAAQEMAQVSPQMHDEFILRYQMPMIEEFGLIAYGCCEDLTSKIDMLRKVPNLRRIAVAPSADVRRCAEQIQQDYVLSYRPNPSEMICCGFDPDHIRKVVKNAMEASKGCHVDITLKDVQTVQHHPENLREWVKIVRDISDNYV